LFCALYRASSSPQIAFGDHPYVSFESTSYVVVMRFTHVGI